MVPDGTPDALVPLAEQVLAWVASERSRNASVPKGWGVVSEDELRRIELCTLAVIEFSMFHALYSISDLQTATAPEGCDCTCA